MMMPQRAPRFARCGWGHRDKRAHKHSTILTSVTHGCENDGFLCAVNENSRSYYTHTADERTRITHSHAHGSPSHSMDTNCVSRHAARANDLDDVDDGANGPVSCDSRGKVLHRTERELNRACVYKNTLVLVPESAQKPNYDAKMERKFPKQTHTHCYHRMI